MRLLCDDKTSNMDMPKSFVYPESMRSLAAHSKTCIEKRKGKDRIITNLVFGLPSHLTLVNS